MATYDFDTKKVYAFSTNNFDTTFDAGYNSVVANWFDIHTVDRLPTNEALINAQLITGTETNSFYDGVSLSVYGNIKGEVIDATKMVKDVNGIIIYDGKNADILRGGAGADVLTGGAGNDTIYGGAGNDNLNGGADNDYLYGDAGDDTINGDAGKDAIIIGAHMGVDVVNGGADDDSIVLMGNFAAGTYSGKIGEFVINNYAYLGSAVPVNHSEAHNIDGGTGTDELITFGFVDLNEPTFAGMENLIMYSNATISEAQLAKFTKVTFMGSLDHTITITDDGTTAVDLSKFTLDGTGDLTINISKDVTTTGTVVNATDTDGKVVIVNPNTPTDTTSPVFATAAVNGTSLVMTYGEALDAAHAPVAGNFAVMAGGAANTVTGVSVSGSTVTLTLTTAVTNGQAVTVAYTDPTTGNDVNAIQDAAGNDVITLAATTVTNNTPAVTDTTAPVFATAAVNGNSLVMTYGEALDAAHAPVAGNFAVMAGGTANTVTGVSVSGSTVTLTLTTAITNGQAVTVAYTDPTTGNDVNAIQDAAGNDVITLAATTVTNNTPATGGYTNSSVDNGKALDTLTEVDASANSFNFTDDASKTGSVSIINFGDNDKISVNSIPAGKSYEFSSEGKNAIIMCVYVDANGDAVSNQIVLTGAITDGALVYNEATFETAVITKLGVAAFDVISFA